MGERKIPREKWCFVYQNARDPRGDRGRRGYDQIQQIYKSEKRKQTYREPDRPSRIAREDTRTTLCDPLADGAPKAPPLGLALDRTRWRISLFSEQVLKHKEKTMSNLLPDVRQQTHKIDTSSDGILITPRGCEDPILVPTSCFSVWLFEGQNPLSIYAGKIQYPCFCQIAGEKKDDGGRKSFFVIGGDPEEGTDWTLSTNIFLKINSKALFTLLLEEELGSKTVNGQRIDVGMTIEAWEDTAEEYSKDDSTSGSGVADQIPI